MAMDMGLDYTKKVLRSLVISCPRGMTIDQLNRDYRNMMGTGIPYALLGYPKLENFLRSLKDTLVVNGSGPDAKVLAIVSDKAMHIDKMVSKQKNSTKVRTVVQQNKPNFRDIPTPLNPVYNNTYRHNQANHQERQRQQPSHHHQSNQSYRSYTQTSKDNPINIKSYDSPTIENHQQRNIIEMQKNSKVTNRYSNKKNKNQEINDQNLQNEIDVTNDEKLNEVKEKLNVSSRSDEVTNLSDSIKELTITDQEAVPELQMNDLIFQLDYPHDTVKYGESIPKSEIHHNITESSYFGIFVTEVHNPYKFWFHLYQEDNELDSLMQDIENFYTNEQSNGLQMQITNMKPGQVCSALFMGMWHRAEILESPQDGKVKVFFVDYGTVSSVELSNVKYLLSEFSHLPSQALRGSLAHIKPATHRWSRDATYAFLDMVSDLLLYAKAIEVNQKDGVIRMVLTDTNKEIDFQINDALIRKGHARYYPTLDSSLSSESQT